MSCTFKDLRYCDKLKRVKAFKEQEFKKYKQELEDVRLEKNYGKIKNLELQIINQQNLLNLLTMFINKIDKECPRENTSEFLCDSNCSPVYEYLKGLYNINVPDSFVETTSKKSA